MRRAAILVLVLICLIGTTTSMTQAQTPTPVLVSTPWGLVTCTHPFAELAGVGCSTTTPVPACVTVASVTVCTREQCTMVNPYTQPDLATACAQFTRQLAPVPTVPPVRLGATLYHPYGSTGIVIGIVRDSAGGEVLVVEVTRAALSHERVGDVFAIKNTRSSSWYVTPTP